MDAIDRLQEYVNREKEKDIVDSQLVEDIEWLLLENKMLRIDISARETVCDALELSLAKRAIDMLELKNGYLKFYVEGKYIYCKNILTDEVVIVSKTEKIMEDTPKKIEKINYYDDSINWVIDGAGQLSDIDKIAIDKINEIINKLNMEK